MLMVARQPTSLEMRFGLGRAGEYTLEQIGQVRRDEIGTLRSASLHADHLAGPAAGKNSGGGTCSKI